MHGPCWLIRCRGQASKTHALHFLAWCRAWIQLAGREADGSPSIACIGSTSARAAEKLGLTRIYYPQEPGVENWAESIMQALADAGKAAHR